jgi:hypothetical protein
MVGYYGGFLAGAIRTVGWWIAVYEQIPLKDRKHHTFVLPIWWDGEDQSKPFNKTTIRNVLDTNAQYYKDMSWNKHNFTYEFSQQTVLVNITKDNPSGGDAAEGAKKIVASLGKVEFKDCDGISLFYNTPFNGSLKTNAGVGTVNGKSIQIN